MAIQYASLIEKDICATIKITMIIGKGIYEREIWEKK